MNFRNNNTNNKQPNKENKRKRKYDRISPEEDTGKEKQIGKKQEINEGEWGKDDSEMEGTLPAINLEELF